MSVSLSLTATSRLGCTLTQGSSASGTRYASHSRPHPRTSAWMELVCFGDFPRVPSLAGTLVQGRQDLLASTNGAGEPSCLIRMEFELFDDESPKTCANFRHLCLGQSASRQGQTYLYQGLTPSYRGTYFHKIIPDLCAQGGDLTMRVDRGANHFSSFGRGWFSDEHKQRCINETGLLMMANNGPNSNGSQFFITTSAEKEKVLTGRYTCFGRVVRGLEEFMREVAPFGDSKGYPSRFVIVTECGVGPIPETLSTSWAPEDTQNTDHVISPPNAPHATEEIKEGREEMKRNVSEEERVSCASNTERKKPFHVSFENSD